MGSPYIFKDMSHPEAQGTKDLPNPQWQLQLRNSSTRSQDAPGSAGKMATKQ